MEKSITKRALSMLLAIALILCTIPAISLPTFAASESDLTFELTYDGYSYEVSDCNENASGELVIPSEYNGKPVTRIGDEAFKDCKAITSVTIPGSVIIIGNRAFENCTGLISITIPNSMTDIYTGVFKNCTGLKKINIPDDAEYIEKTLFADTAYYKDESNWENGILYIGNSLIAAKENIESCVIKNGTKRIASAAFSDCKNITSITIPDSVTEICDHAFEKCVGLTSITIPGSVTNIGYCAFKGCAGLTSITIPGSVTNIGYCAFEGCVGLTSITIPSSVLGIGSGAFSYCTSLKEISVSSRNGNYSSQDGVLFDDDKSVLIAYPCGKAENSYTIPDTVYQIDYSAFEGCVGLTAITIPAGVRRIMDGAFRNCTGLISLTILGSEIDFFDEVFSGCTSINEINVPDDATYMYTGYDGIGSFADTAYYKDESNWESGILYIGNHLIKVKDDISGACVIKDGIKKIPRYAFSDRTNLTSVTIPNSVISIEEYAFAWCENLKSVTLPADISYIGYGAFRYCNSDLTIKAPTYSAMHDYTIRNSINFVSTGEVNPFRYELNYSGESYEFSHCALAFKGEVVIPSEYNGKPVTRIGYSAFEDCKAITSVTIPDSVTDIDSSAFENCTGLTSVTIPDSVTDIGYNVFEGYNADVTIIAPKYSAAHDYAYKNSINFISNGEVEPVKYVLSDDGNSYIFEHCAASYQGEIIIQGVYNGKPVTKIGEGAFRGCTGLTAVTIPNSVTQIEESAFSGCVKLKSITIPRGVEEIERDTFWGCSGLTSVTIPDSVTKIGFEAFRNCTGLTSIIIPNSVTSIMGGAFQDCTRLKEIDMPNDLSDLGADAFNNTAFYNDESNWENKVLYIGNFLAAVKPDISGDCVIKSGITRIASSAFEDCAELTSITIPYGVTHIGSEAFEDCTGLKSITIPKSVIEIEWGAFRGCAGLESITIPNGVTYMGYDKFEGCASLKEINIPDDISVSWEDFKDTALYKDVSNWENGVLYVSNHLVTAGVSGDYVVKNGTKEICDLAFKGCTSLKSVTLPDTLKSIGSYAFEKCTSLESVTIPGSVKTIGHEAFYECTGLKSVKFLEGIESIGSQAFWKCVNLEEINIPKSVTSIGYDVLQDTAYIKNAENWTDGALYVDNCLLKANDTLPTVYEVKSGTRLIGDYTFLKNATEFVYTVGSGEGLSITSVKIPGSVKSIGTGAFVSCDKLSSAEIEDGVKNIGSSAFLNCTSLKTAEIPESVTEIGERALGYTGGCWGEGKKQPGFTISGYKNSAAEKYADENKFAFNALGTAVADEESGIKVSGNIDEAAALEVKLLSSDKSKITYDITLTKDGKAIQPDGTVTVKIPVPESLDGAKCRVYRVEENGKNTDMNAEFKDGFMVFKTAHFSKYILTTDDLSVVYGDINGDGKINTVDLAMLRKYLANKDPATGESSVSVGAGADVNGDGKINTVDLALLRKYLANKDPVTGESSVTLGPR